MRSDNISYGFIFLSLVSLLAALLFGLIGAIQYIIPGFLYDLVSFEKARPMHVTLIITWLFCSAIGGIYYYNGSNGLKNGILAFLQLFLIILTGSLILYSYFSGQFGGREYFEFPPYLALPVGVSWIFFMVVYFSNTSFRIREWKIYHWMWATGIIFFMLTFMESYLWQFDFFNRNIVRDITVQWKALGAFVGSWNMLIYGTAFYLMEKIGGDEKVTTSNKTYFFYFLGLTNLMFNWGHHTYNIPAAPWIRNIAYLISMTELLILGNIIFNWRTSVKNAISKKSVLSFRFLFASDIWIFANLALAIAISVPAINQFTHGTHITVAHAMGATIGINTMILFASLLYIGGHRLPLALKHNFSRGLYILNFSLFLFWISLIGAGFTRTALLLDNVSHYELTQQLQPWYYGFAISGMGLFAGFLFVILPLIQMFNPFNFSTYNPLIKKEI